MSDDTPVWERRFRAPTVTFPWWSPDAPERLVVASNGTGSYQVYAWDRAAGTRRRVTDHPIGIPGGTPTADGSGVVWFHDATGDEFGRWMVEPFEGGEARPFLPGVSDGWPSGLAVGRGITVAGVGERDGFRVFGVEAGAPPRLLAEHSEQLQVGGARAEGFNLAGLSRDETLVCLEHAEHGDNLHLALRVVDARTGEVVGDLWDGGGRGLSASVWSPVPGDRRLVVVHEREDRERPAIWDLTTGERRDVRLDLPGPVFAYDWWPDGSAVLLCHVHEGRDQLLRYDLGSGELSAVPHPPGYISGARVRPDGEVWLRVSSGVHQARVLSEGGEEVVAAEGLRAPDGVAFRSWHFTNLHDQRVHGFVATPDGPGPHPLVMEVHGGPHWLWLDEWRPQVQAWVDHGFAVAMVNYRGSIGYGAEWRDAIIGNPGFTELEDIVAGVEDLVARGVADPDRVVLSGESWGGYLTLLGLGLDPDRWAAGVAGVPVADYAAAYEDEAPSLQTMDRGLFGGSPEERPELYRERSPITYLDRVRAPVLVLAGENDSRCPIRQIENYVKAMEARGGEIEVYRYETGHSSFLQEERIRQMRAKLDFVLRKVERGRP